MWGHFFDVASTLHIFLAGFHSLPVNSYLLFYWKSKDFRLSSKGDLIFLHIILHLDKQLSSQGLN